MPVPQSIEARRFYRCAGRRFDEAGVLHENGYETGAVYLAGYGVECMLKAMILAATPRSEERAVLDSFRGKGGHCYDSLKGQYLEKRGASIPRQANRAFTLVQNWSTDLRCSPAEIDEREARGFLNAVKMIMDWADGRL